MPSATITTTTGNILAVNVTPASWATQHDALAADVKYSSSINLQTELSIASSTTDQWTEFQRCGMTFNTSTLPDDAIITAAQLRVYATGGTSTFSTTPSITVVSFTPATPTTLAVGDYDQFGNDPLSNEVVLTDLHGTVPSPEYEYFTLNSTGRALISKTGYTTFGFRLSWDYENAEPDHSGVHSALSATCQFSAAVSGQPPALLITYSTTYENTVTESLRLSDFSDSYLTNFGPEQLALSDSASVDVEGANPTSLFSVRIAFASNPFDNSPVWVDVTENLMSFHIRRGRQWELNRLEAGTAVVRLKNIAGDYWPNNSSSALYPYVLPWKRINIRALYNGLTYDLYTGYIEAWEPSFLLRPIKAPVMDLTCSDGIKSLSQYLLNNTTGYSQEISGTRIDNVLTSLGWPSTARNIDAGQSLIQATGALEDVNAMTHIFTVEDTELGIFYESPSGAMVFQDRHKRLKAPYTISQSSFGDTATTFGYTGIDLSFEDLRIYNDIRVTPLSGTTEQVATSTTSQDVYGPRSLQRPSLLMVSDAEALAQAQYLLSRYATPVMRCRKIEIRPNADADNLYPCVLGYDLSTRVTIKLTQATIDKDYHIEGIYHDWDVQDAAGLKTTWMLSDAETEQFWILEDPVFGVLDSTTIPAW